MSVNYFTNYWNQSISPELILRRTNSKRYLSVKRTRPNTLTTVVFVKSYNILPLKVTIYIQNVVQCLIVIVLCAAACVKCSRSVIRFEIARGIISTILHISLNSLLCIVHVKYVCCETRLNFSHSRHINLKKFIQTIITMIINVVVYV